LAFISSVIDIHYKKNLLSARQSLVGSKGTLFSRPIPNSSKGMSFHVKRSQTSHLGTLQQYNGLRTTRWVSPPPLGKSVLEIQTTHTPTALQKVPEGKNYLTPPYHCTLNVSFGGRGELWLIVA
jgi:hypothetical protein